MEKTTNYDMFHKIECNREKDEANVLRIMRSIQQKNLLKFRPIKVNENYGVIDGQHRLEAARRLQVPIYYEVEKDMEEEDIYIINQGQKNWRLEDYLNFHVAHNAPEYVRFKRFMDKNKLKLRPALTALGIPVSGDIGEDFKRGKFKFPGIEEEVDAMEILQRTKEIVEYLLPKTQGMKSFLKGTRFQRCLYLFFCVKSVDRDLFFQKLPYKLDVLRPSQRIVDILKMLESIYNWKNKNPISLDDSMNSGENQSAN